VQVMAFQCDCLTGQGRTDRWPPRDICQSVQTQPDMFIGAFSPVSSFVCGTVIAKALALQPAHALCVLAGSNVS
jgi:hypothetical protein